MSNKFKIVEAVRGDFDSKFWGQLARNTGSGAASGAAVGALGAGVTALPGAGIGAAIGATGTLTENLWYRFQPANKKISWQAGDMEENLNDIANVISKYDKPFGESIKIHALQYKEYIDNHIRDKKTEAEEGKNIFDQKYNEWLAASRNNTGAPQMQSQAPVSRGRNYFTNDTYMNPEHRQMSGGGGYRATASINKATIIVLGSIIKDLQDQYQSDEITKDQYRCAVANLADIDNLNRLIESADFLDKQGMIRQSDKIDSYLVRTSQFKPQIADESGGASEFARERQKEAVLWELHQRGLVEPVKGVVNRAVQTLPNLGEQGLGSKFQQLGINELSHLKDAGGELASTGKTLLNDTEALGSAAKGLFTPMSAMNIAKGIGLAGVGALVDYGTRAVWDKAATALMGGDQYMLNASLKNLNDISKEINNLSTSTDAVSQKYISFSDNYLSQLISAISQWVSQHNKQSAATQPKAQQTVPQSVGYTPYRTPGPLPSV